LSPSGPDPQDAFKEEDDDEAVDAAISQNKVLTNADQSEFFSKLESQGEVSKKKKKKKRDKTRDKDGLQSEAGETIMDGQTSKRKKKEKKEKRDKKMKVKNLYDDGATPADDVSESAAGGIAANQFYGGSNADIDDDIDSVIN